MPAPPWCKRRRRFGSLWWHLLSPQAESRPLAPTASGAAASICRQHTGRMHGCLRPYLRARLLHASSRRAYCTHRERLLRPCLYLCCAVACDATGPTSWGWCSATSTALSRPWRSLRPLRLRPHGRRCMPRKIRAPASVPSLWSQWRAKASGTWPLPARPVNSLLLCCRRPPLSQYRPGLITAGPVAITQGATTLPSHPSTGTHTPLPPQAPAHHVLQRHRSLYSTASHRASPPRRLRFRVPTASPPHHQPRVAPARAQPAPPRSSPGGGDPRPARGGSKGAPLPVWPAACGLRDAADPRLAAAVSARGLRCVPQHASRQQCSSAGCSASCAA